MNSYDNLDNFKYLGKIVAITLIVFIILKYAINMRQIEAVLLSAIITVSILIIENIIFINNEASDPLNCDQCKVQQVKDNTETNLLNSINQNNLNNSNTLDNSNIPDNSKPGEQFGIIDDLHTDLKNITNSILNNTNENFENVK